MANKDAYLKQEIRQVIENCHLDNAIIDREVHINWTGERDHDGKYVDQREIDVIAKFNYRGQNVMLFFECEDSGGAKGVRKEYRVCEADVKGIMQHLNGVRVLGSSDSQIKGPHFRNVDLIRVCFSYGTKFPDAAYRTCVGAARPHSFLVWNRLALIYYLKISSVLRK